MSKGINDIQDDDFRVIGLTGGNKAEVQHHTKKTLWIYVVTAVVVCASSAIIFWPKKADTHGVGNDVPVVFDPMPEQKPEHNVEETKPLGDYSDTIKAYTEHLRDTINDIALDIYIPHNAVPQLMIGVPDISDKSIILATQAADIRADNGKIVGAFVAKGKPYSWGLSKKGYCGIIDGRLTVGVADNSPLFEEATEKEGYFFRQYPLVDNGVLVENEPKGKSIRKALCDRNGEIMIIMTQTPESFHDFAQALVDLKVDNAIYTVGSTSYGYFRDKFDHFEQIYEKRRGGYKYENFIVWKKN